MNILKKVVRKISRWVLKNELKALRQNTVHLEVSYVLPSNRFLNKNVYVTGGASGIGFVIAKAFLAEGANVILCARNEVKLNEAKEKLQKITPPNQKCLIQVIDISRISDITAKLMEADRMLNGIDIFINAAGVSDYDGDKMFTEEMYNYICDINQKGLFYMNKFEGDYLIEHGIRGKIINITSKAGERIGFDPYTLSKWGANSLTKGNARRLAPYHICVNGIAPGVVPTNITKELQKHKDGDYYTENNSTKRFTMPEEVAETTLFLASGSANNIVGQIIVIDGGSYS
jgi:3-oxoacyl-[acyl-carrier protein] reductase